MARINILLILMWGQFSTIVGQSIETQETQTKKRVAFVVGINEYIKCKKLKNAVRDAKLMKKTLEKLDFEVVYHQNLNQKELYQELGDFMKKVNESTVSLFYFAGHGVEMQGKNYILPSDANIDESIEECGKTSLDVQDIIYNFERSTESFSIMILDACRNDPQLKRSRSAKPNRGFQISNNEQTKNSILAFSTSSSKLAEDGDHENSNYTKILCDELEKDQRISEVFQNTYERVCKKTENKQIPESRNKTAEDIRLASHLTKPDYDSELITGSMNYRTAIKPVSTSKWIIGLNLQSLKLQKIGHLSANLLTQNPSNPEQYLLGNQPLDPSQKQHFDNQANGQTIQLPTGTFIKSSPESAIPLSFQVGWTAGFEINPGYVFGSGIFLQMRNAFRHQFTSDFTNYTFRNTQYSIGAGTGFLRKWGLGFGAYKLLNQKSFGFDASLIFPAGKRKVEIKGMYEYHYAPVGEYHYLNHPVGVSLGLVF